MPILNEIAYKMRKMPILKRYIKNSYQYIGNLISDKKTLPNYIEQISDNNNEHLFGYYDKCPWNKDEDKMIYLHVENADKSAAPRNEAKIILKDLKLNTETVLEKTRAWNVQQGCMLQWMGPDFNSRILYNDFIEGELKTVIINIKDNKKTIIDSPVYAVDSRGKWGLSLDFYRLHRMRPGYGYSNKEDSTKNELLPEGFCIWKVNLEENIVEGIVSYNDLCKINYKETMDNAEHKVNHIMINPSGNRFMFLHRWIKNGVKYTRLLTANIDGSEIYNLLDEDMISHCTWKDDTTILGWARKNDIGNKYFLMKDKEHTIKAITNDKLVTDGHPSYSPTGEWFVTDTYPDFKRKQRIYLYNEKEDKAVEVASIYANIKYINDCRCDLHPRWNYSGTKICFDGAQNKKRQVYVIEVGDRL